MKTKIIIPSIFLISTVTLMAQISIPQLPNANINGSNVFLDASSSFSSEVGAPNSTGKGLVIPSVDLVNFEFDLTLADGVSTFPTYFDGMLVYNSSTNNTLTIGNRSSTSTAVTPGYYYYSNPNGALNGNVTDGIWTPIGNNTMKNIPLAPNDVTTSIYVDGAKVYATKGTFEANGTSAIVTIVPPTGITGIYRIAIYKTEVSTDSATAGNSISRKLSSEVYEFNLNSSTNNVVTGYSPFSVVYPAGIYNYTLEYFK